MAKSSKSGHGKGTRKYGRNKERPCQKRYVSQGRMWDNKFRRVQKLVNKFGHSIKIKVKGEWVTIKPIIAKVGEKSPTSLNYTLLCIVVLTTIR